MNKCKIIVPRGCRSDWGLSDPIIKRLKEAEWCEVIVIDLNPASFGDSYFKTKSLILHFEPDLFLAIGDRIEMCAATCAAFHTSVPIAHYGAGITNYPIATLDDINRHCITLWSEILLCEDYEAEMTAFKILDSIGKANNIRKNFHIIGHTHIDDIEVDESLVPSDPYDLVLYNPTTMYKEDVSSIARDLNNVIWIGSNPDPNYLENKLLDYTYDYEYYENLPRPQFLGLLKNCKRFISNSSCTYYEAPLFLKPEQIIIIGDRNCKRSSKGNIIL